MNFNHSSPELQIISNNSSNHLVIPPTPDTMHLYLFLAHHTKVDVSTECFQVIFVISSSLSRVILVTNSSLKTKQWDRKFPGHWLWPLCSLRGHRLLFLGGYTTLAPADTLVWTVMETGHCLKSTLPRLCLSSYFLRLIGCALYKVNSILVSVGTSLNGQCY